MNVILSYPIPGAVFNSAIFETLFSERSLTYREVIIDLVYCNEGPIGVLIIE